MVVDPFRRNDMLAATRVMYPILLPPESFSFQGIDFVVEPDSRLAVPTTPEPPLWEWRIDWCSLRAAARASLSPIPDDAGGQLSLENLQRALAEAAMPTRLGPWREQVVFFSEVQDPTRWPSPPNELIEHSVSDLNNIQALMDLARDGNEQMFMELAGCLGVATEKLHTMWQGTRRRLGLKDPRDPLAVPDMTLSPSLLEASDDPD